MHHTTKDVSAFVDGITRYVRSDKTGTKESLPKMEHLFEKLSGSAKHEHEARIHSPVKLTDGEIDSVRKILSRLVGHDVTVSQTIKKSLLGGLRIEIGDWVFDATLVHQLKRIREELSV